MRERIEKEKRRREKGKRRKREEEREREKESNSVDDGLEFLSGGIAQFYFEKLDGNWKRKKKWIDGS